MDAAGQALTTNGSFTDLYNSISNWTLAQDVALLDRIDQLSKKVASRTEATSKDIKDISDQFYKARIRLHSAINSFNSLSNTQFIESRVREDDSYIRKKNQKVETDSSTPVETAEQRKMRELKEAISMTQAVMRDYFHVVEVSSDDEDGRKRPKRSKSSIRQAKNPYLHRPLPFIIGTEEFNRDKYVGLRPDLTDEARKNEVDEEALSAKVDALPAVEAVQLAINGHSPVIQRPASPPVVRTVSVNQQQQPQMVAAGKSGIISSESEDESDIFNTRSIKDSSSSKPSITPSPTSGMRLPPVVPPLTRSSSQTSSAKTGNLFNMEDDDDEGDLFSTKKIKPSVAVNQVNQPAPLNQSNQARPTVKPPVALRAPSLPSPSTQRTVKKASIFADDDDDSDLFSSRKVDIGQPIKTSPAMEVQNKLEQSPISAADNRQVSPTFDNPPIEANLPANATSLLPGKVVMKAKKKSTLFDDDSDQEDLFTLPSAKSTANMNTAVEKLNRPETIESGINQQSKVERPSVKTGLSSVPRHIPPSSRSSSQSGSVKARNLFLDDDDDDDDEDVLFSSKKALPSKAENHSQKREVKTTQPSLAANASSPSISTVMGKPVVESSVEAKEEVKKKVGKKAVLFDDDDEDSDDLFALSSAKTAIQSTTLPNQWELAKPKVTESKGPFNQSETNEQLTVATSKPAATPRLHTPSAKTLDNYPQQKEEVVLADDHAEEVAEAQITRSGLVAEEKEVVVDGAKVEEEKPKARPPVRARTSLLSLSNHPTQTPTEATALSVQDLVAKSVEEETSDVSGRMDDEIVKAVEEVEEEEKSAMIPLATQPSIPPALATFESTAAVFALSDQAEGNNSIERTTTINFVVDEDIQVEQKKTDDDEDIISPRNVTNVVSPLEEDPLQEEDISKVVNKSAFSTTTKGDEQQPRSSIEKPAAVKLTELTVSDKRAKQSTLFANDDDNFDEELFAPSSVRTSVKTEATVSSPSTSLKSGSIASSVVSDQSRKPPSPAMGGGLFEEDDSDDEDLFSIRPATKSLKTHINVNQAKKPSVQPVSQPQHTLHSTSLLPGPPPLDNVDSSESDDDLFK